MSVVFNRTELGGVTVRFFFKRADAINRANAHTRGTNQQHNAVHTSQGWLVENAVTKELFDIDGKLPENTNVGSIRR